MSNEANDFSKVVIRNAKLHFRNFSGKESEYNKAGYRNFCVELDHQLAIDMIDDGWNIKQFKPKPDQDEEPGFYIKVNVMFGNRPPKIVIKSSGEETYLFQRLKCNPYHKDFHFERYKHIWFLILIAFSY